MSPQRLMCDTLIIHNFSDSDMPLGYQSYKPHSNLDSHLTTRNVSQYLQLYCSSGVSSSELSLRVGTLTYCICICLYIRLYERVTDKEKDKGSRLAKIKHSRDKLSIHLQGQLQYMTHNFTISYLERPQTPCEDSSLCHVPFSI